MSPKEVEHWLVDQGFDYEAGVWTRKFSGQREFNVVDKYIQDSPEEAYEFIQRELKWRKQS